MKQIPKKLHYVWVGGNKKSKHVLACIKSWEKYCPDYEIIEWNEHNFDVDAHPFVKQAYEAKNWALMSDVIRVWVLYHYGGIYLDTDMELVSSINDLLNNEAFFSYESPYWVGSAVLASIPQHPIFKRILQRYNNKQKIGFHTNPLTVHAFTAALRYDYGFKPTGKTCQLDPHICIMSSNYFYPQHYMSGKLTMTAHTKGIHHYVSSWHSASQSKSQKFAKIAYTIMGKHLFKLFERIVGYSYYRTIKKEFKAMDKEGFNHDK